MLLQRYLGTLFVLISLPFAAAISIGQQFNLKPGVSASSCFLTCHTMATNSVLLPGRDINFVTAIGKNCAFNEWAVMVSACLPYTCVSAPDLGYAIEYGHSFCARAGYHKVNLTLPQWFLDSEGGAWYNETLAKRSAASSYAGPAATWTLAPAALAAVLVAGVL